MQVLISGGAGFIGLAVARHLLSVGESVTILDNFHPQVHGGRQDLPQDIAGRVRLIRGDVADRDAWLKALAGQNAVLHLAAETGTGQSMYEVERYSRTNLTGTALLLDLLANRQASVERIVIASSRAIYGEGAYRCEQDGLVYPRPRSSGDKEAGEFDPVCPACQGPCTAEPTPESAPAQAASFYGLTKLTQEQMALLFGRVLGIPSVALRYQNVFGPGQSLLNPYTGILGVFTNLARVGKPIQVFEDGMESRDFVYIDDVAAATVAALLTPLEGCHSVNVGSGERTTVLRVAEQVNAHSGGRSTVQVTGAFREGDIRHGFADLAYAQRLLGYRPAWSFPDGLERFLSWAEHTGSSTERYEHSLAEMRHRGLLRE